MMKNTKLAKRWDCREKERERENLFIKHGIYRNKVKRRIISK